jgi:hypothetical protein
LFKGTPRAVPDTADANRSMHLRLARGEGVELRAEEVNPEIPVCWDP